MANVLFLDWLEDQLLAINAYLKACGKLPAISEAADTAEYHLGYRDAIKRVLKQYKTMMKEAEGKRGLGVP